MPWPYWLLLLWPLPVFIVAGWWIWRNIGWTQKQWMKTPFFESFNHWAELICSNRRHISHINRELPQTQRVVRGLNRSRRKHRTTLRAHRGQMRLIGEETLQMALICPHVARHASDVWERSRKAYEATKGAEADVEVDEVPESGDSTGDVVGEPEGGEGQASRHDG